MEGDRHFGFGEGEGRTTGRAGTADTRLSGVPRQSAREPPLDDGATHATGWLGRSYAGATLSLVRDGGADAGDRYGASGTLAPLIEGSALVVASVGVGTVTRNSGGRLLLTFSGPNADEDQVDAVLRQITYANAAHVSNAPVELRWAFANGTPGAPVLEGCTRVALDGTPIWRAARRAT